MPVTKKRASPEDSENSATNRPAKSQKTSKGKKAAAKAKPAIPLSEFKDKARPLHIHITHTPPSIEAPAPATKLDDDSATALIAEVESGGASSESEDPDATITTIGNTTDAGFISSLALLPSSFSTGSYGWKGSKKIVVELQNSEDGPNGREKVQVMLTINATVVGSKQSASSNKDEGSEEEQEAVEEKDD